MCRLEYSLSRRLLQSLNAPKQRQKKQGVSKVKDGISILTFTITSPKSVLNNGHLNIYTSLTTLNLVYNLIILHI